MIISILLAAGVSFVIGGILNVLLQKQFAKSEVMLQNKKKQAGPGKKVLAGIFAANIAMAAALYYFVEQLGVDSVSHILVLTAVALGGFVAPTSLGQVWGGKTVRWWLLTNTVNAISLFAMVATIVMLR